METPSLKLYECVPNISEGQNKGLIQLMAKTIDRHAEVDLLHVDSGVAANRTVFTYIGSYNGIYQATKALFSLTVEHIDMRTHLGVHPRVGAIDVCPIIPLHRDDREEAKKLASEIAQAVGSEGIPVYFYEHSATEEHRRLLAQIRKGSYEGFAEKMKSEGWSPDHGPELFNPRTGATVLGARDFLLAYNISLDTQDEKLAKYIASQLRESKKEKLYDVTTGLPTNNFPGVRAIGWYIEEYGHAQISMNVTDISAFPMYALYESAKALSEKNQVKILGSELIGLIPKQVMIETGVHYTNAENQEERELCLEAVKAMKLDGLKPFDIDERVIEYAYQKKTGRSVSLRW